jgi:hypothetical protein
MNMKSISIILLSVLSVAVPARSEISADEIMKMSPADVEAALPSEHPATYYMYAARLFGEENKDDAVFWFYVGQLRYRIHLKARPEGDPSEDPALFASLNATIGQSINEYAGGDVNGWIAAIDRALKWDSLNPDGFTPKHEFEEAREEIRKGLLSMRELLTQNADRIREQRKANGLENRG